MENNLRRSRKGFTKEKEKVDVDTVGRVKRPNGRCKKHPKHRQSPGVCALCLREKLIQTQLPAAAFTSSCRRTTTFDANDHVSSSSSYVSSLPSSYYYSSSSVSSSCAASPVHCFCCFNNNNNNNNTTEGIKRSSFSIFLLSSRQQHNAIIRSKSSLDNNQRETKGGFRFKLFRPKTNKGIEDDQKETKEKMVRSMSIAS